MADHAPDRWQDAAENICQAAEGPISSTVRKAADDIYASVMETVQDYLRENVEFNLSSKLQGYADTANRLRAENEQLKRRADIAEQMAEALRPFADYLDEVKIDLNSKGEPLPDDQGVGWIYLTVGDFRRAREAILKARQASNEEARK
jgi:aconitase B